MTLHARAAPQPDPPLPSPALASHLPDAPGWALFVDLDGTLCEYRDDPQAVRLDEAQCALLQRLSRRVGGALCVLSGRTASDLDRALHGCEVLRCGDHGHSGDAGLPEAAARDLEQAEPALRALAAAFEAHGVWVERKPAACALHYRRSPELADRLTAAVRELSANLAALRLLEGQCVFELVACGDSKGRALRRLMQRPPFAGRVPVALGDDVTDEDAFVAAAALGGFGIGVGPRPSVAARHRLLDVAACNAWLRGLAESPVEVADA